MRLSVSVLVGAALFSPMLLGCSNSPPGGESAGAGKPGVILLRYKPGSESTKQREDGFLEVIEQEYPGIKVLSSNQYAGTTTGDSKKAAAQLLLKYGDQVNGVFAVCEPNASGVLQALDEAGMAGKVKFVGFDPIEQLVVAMQDKEMDGVVLQDPVTMGYLSVKTLVAHLNGEKVEKRISTGEFVATPENMNTDEMKRLLNPPKFAGSPPAIANPKYRIGVIPKGLTHEFWQSVRYGAQKAGEELGVEILWDGPPDEGNVSEQIKIVQSMVTKGADGIVLAPNDSQSLVSAVADAKQKGIPTVIFDSGLDAAPEDYVSYVATDNRAGGKLAAHELAKAMGVAPAAKPAATGEAAPATNDAEQPMAETPATSE